MKVTFDQCGLEFCIETFDNDYSYVNEAETVKLIADLAMKLGGMYRTVNMTVRPSQIVHESESVDDIPF